jgi:uncharacterized protein YkwD
MPTGHSLPESTTRGVGNSTSISAFRMLSINVLLVMKIIICAFLALLLPKVCAQGQTNWKSADYQSVTVGNFRNFAAFKKPINARLIDNRLLNACLYYVVNEQRQRAHLAVVPHHAALETAAFFHSKKMADFSFFDHVNPKDATRAQPDQRALLAGITNPSIAECIAVQGLDQGATYLSLAEAFTQAWMNSPPHRDIILSPNGKALGAGIYSRAGGRFGLRGTLAFQWFDAVVWDQKLAVEYLP